VGLAQRGFEIILELLEKALDLIKDCDCEEGCPSCIHSPKCGNGNKPLDKEAARLILEGLLGHIPLSEIIIAEETPEPAPHFPEEEPVPEKAKGPRVLCLDLETQKTARDVGGWKNTHLMRISVAVLFDSLENRFHAFEEEELDALLDRLDKADLIIGFNIKGFDYRVLGAYTNRDLKTLPTFDILEDVYKRLGFRLSLDHLANETLGQRKTADGLQAVEWFQKGEMEKLAAYCQNDVATTWNLFQFGLENGHLVYKQKQAEKRVRLLVDWNLDELLK
jgi:DEAD/DEAH box helicase domain-containing protein